MPPAKQNQQPWYKRHPLLAGAGTLALGGGAAYLGDKLLNGGKLTSQLLGSTQTANEPPKVIPQAEPVASSASAANPEWLQKGLDDNAYSERLRNYDGNLTDPKYEGGVFGRAGTTAQTAGGVAWGANIANDLAQKSKYIPAGALGIASKVIGGAGKALPFIAPISDAQSFTEQPHLTQAYAESLQGMGLNPEWAKPVLGAGGAALGATAYTPIGAALQPVISVYPKLLNDWIRRSETDAAANSIRSHTSSDMFNRLIHAVKAGDTQTISLIKQNFPHLGDQFYEGKLRDTITNAYASLPKTL